MEYSSPLAAMRPPACPAWVNRRDLLPSHSILGPSYTYGANSFDFKTMSMQQKPVVRQDYFSLRIPRGSSPTASLTADLDANFHIDKRFDPLPAFLSSPSHGTDPPVQSGGSHTPTVSFYHRSV